MCRQNQLLGWMLVAFGIGVLVGMRLESGLSGTLLAMGAVVGGFLVLTKK